MLYVFVASYVNLAEAQGPRLAFIVHMAEGGGTTGYLSRDNPNGVSVHFVIERTGRIVQMLGYSRMHSSIRASTIRGTNDPAYDWLGTPVRYGVSAAKAVMGDWANTLKTLGPNHASIAVEIEGFAADGPNAAQRVSLAALYADVQSRYPDIKALGHRDFADYKACPGKKIPWDVVGGHALSLPAHPSVIVEDDMLITLKAEDWTTVGSKPYRTRPERTNEAIAGYTDGPVSTLGEGMSGGNNWRVTRLVSGATVYYLRGDLLPAVQGGDPARDASLTAFIAGNVVTLDATRKAGIAEGRMQIKEAVRAL